MSLALANFQEVLEETSSSISHKFSAIEVPMEQLGESILDACIHERNHLQFILVYISSPCWEKWKIHFPFEIQVFYSSEKSVRIDFSYELSLQPPAVFVSACIKLPIKVLSCSPLMNSTQDLAQCSGIKLSPLSDASFSIPLTLSPSFVMSIMCSSTCCGLIEWFGAFGNCLMYLWSSTGRQVEMIKNITRELCLECQVVRPCILRKKWEGLPFGIIWGLNELTICLHHFIHDWLLIYCGLQE